MISRILVNSADRSRGTQQDFAFDVGSSRLNEFAGRLVRYGIEWITPVVASTTGPSYEQNTSRPLSLLLYCSSFPAINTHKAWAQNDKRAVLALLPSWKQTAYYGVMADTPYLQSNCCGGITLGDNIAAIREFEFQLYDSGTPFTAADAEDFQFSIVFWTDEPERPVSDSFYHMWVSTADSRVTQLRGDASHVVIPFDFNTFEMNRSGQWNMAVSYCSPVYVDKAIVDLPTGLLLSTPSFVIDPHTSRNILAYLPGSNDDGGERYYGYKQTIKPVSSDTVGIPIRPPIDNLGFIELELREAVSYAFASDVSDYTACITFYKVN